MTKRVLDVGNCTADHTAIDRMLKSNFDVELVQAHSGNEAIRLLHDSRFDLVLLNRIFDCDGHQGLDVLKQIKTNPQWEELPVMLVSNLEEHQQTAVSLGAETGFGKSELRQAETREKLERILR